jgi:hypothetical protein
VNRRGEPGDAAQKGLGAMTELMIRVVRDPDEDDLRLRQTTTRLRALLSDDADEVAQVEDETAGESPDADPDGSKGIGSMLLGWLTVTVRTFKQLQQVAEILDQWAERNKHDVQLTIGGDSLTLSAASAEERRLLLDAFLARHGALPAPESVTEIAPD